LLEEKGDTHTHTHIHAHARTGTQACTGTHTRTHIHAHMCGRGGLALLDEGNDIELARV
jgi:hypothetical protein